MTLFQLLLLVIVGTVFYLFFKQLFGGNYPKRGVDFESNLPNDQIGGLTQPDKIFAKPVSSPNRIEELLNIADKAAGDDDWLEVKKAMQSAAVLDESNTDVLRRLGAAYMHINDFANAKETYEKLLEIDPDDDLAESSLANALHKLGEDTAAVTHHERSLVLDGKYAPNYYNYANTLYDTGRTDEALGLYKKALELDPELENAKKMIEEIEK